MRLLSFLFKCLTIAGLIFVEAGFLGRYNAYADLTAHFVIYSFLAFGILALMFALIRKWLWALTAMLGLLLSAIPPTLAYLPPSALTQSAGTELTFLQFNVNYANPSPEKVLAWITALTRPESEHSSFPMPDIILLQELSPQMADALAPLLDRRNTNYPYKILAPRPGAFGMALLSRHPLRDVQRASFSAAVPPHSLATVTLADGSLFRLYETHTLPPISPYHSSVRNNELIQLADLIASDPEPYKIFLGDFNITPYSAWFRDTESHSGLRSSMQGLGFEGLFHGTWPSFLPALFRLPIDHLLVSPHITVIKRNVGPDLGSDHLPVITTLRFSPFSK